MINKVAFPGSIGAKSASLVNAKPIAAPLIKARLLGTRYDPQGAITPKFGFKVDIPKPIKRERKNNMEVNGVPLKALEVQIAREGGGSTGITVKKQKNSMTDELAKKVNSVRQATQKATGKGRIVDFSA